MKFIMKQVLKLFLLLFTFSLFSCISSQKEEQQEYNKKEQQKGCLKDSLLFSCLYKAKPDREMDMSAAV